MDLLEDLLSGIYGCALLFREYQASDEVDEEFDEAASAASADEVVVEDVVGLMLSQTGAAETDGDGADVEDDDVGFVEEEGDDEDGDWPEVGSQDSWMPSAQKLPNTRRVCTK